jgi:hypothetical protein
MKDAVGMGGKLKRQLVHAKELQLLKTGQVAERMPVQRMIFTDIRRKGQKNMVLVKVSFFHQHSEPAGVGAYPAERRSRLNEGVKTPEYPGVTALQGQMRHWPSPSFFSECLSLNTHMLRPCFIVGNIRLGGNPPVPLRRQGPS